MVYLDRRAGSAELYTPLLAANISTELTTLDYGDCCLVGHGPRGESVLVGVERKTVRDLIQSLTSGRLSGHQVPGLVATYRYGWLLVEGTWRTDDRGYATLPAHAGQRRGKTGPHAWVSTGLKASALEGYLLTLTLRAGLHVQRTGRLEDTVAWIGHLHHWWTAKPWAEHRAHLALHHPEVDSRLWVAPNTLQKVAACLPGIGGEKSLAVAAHFGTVLQMALADEGAWQAIPGIGKTIAGRVTRVLQQGD